MILGIPWLSASLILLSFVIMTSVKLNMLEESAKYSDLQSFIRARDNAAALANFIIDEGHRTTFFANFPGLIHQEYFVGSKGSKGNEMVGDVAKIRFENFTMGIGVPGLPSASRQLAGNEAMSSTAYREEQISFGGHRYAVAIENMKSRKVLPERNVARIIGSTTKWWAFQDDLDTFMTLFRDYPFYVSETNGMTLAQINADIATMFGRGFNDLGGARPDVIFAGDGTKGDIEPGATVTGFRSTAAGDKVGLVDTDTLTSTFLEKLSNYLGNSGLKMPALTVENELPFYGLILEQQDVTNIMLNSSSTLVADLKNMTAFSQVSSETLAKHPIFSKVLGGLFQIKFMKYSQIDPQVDSRIQAPNNIQQQVNTIYDDLYGKAIKPEAQVLAATVANGAITGLTSWAAGYLVAGVTRDVTQGAYQLYLSSGANMFPYFDDTVNYGADSINHIDNGYYNSGGVAGAFDGTYVGRLQVGSGTTATTRWKITYKGPYYAGSIQIGTNLGTGTFVEDAYKMEILGLHRYVPGTNSYAASSTLAADWAAFKTFLGVNGVSNAIDPALVDRVYTRNRRVHMFDTVRTIVFGKSLLYKINGEGVDFQNETRDYNAFSGYGLNVIQGKKVVTSGRGLVNNYAILVFKRPLVIL